MTGVKYTLTVYTTAGATVVVNGVSQTANSSGYAYYELKKGTYSYSASKSGYTSRSGSVTVTGNQTLSIVLSLDISDILLLLHGNSYVNDITGSNVIRSGVSLSSGGKFNYGSYYFNGGSYLRWNMGKYYETFTFECWFKKNRPSTSDYHTFFHIQNEHQGTVQLRDIYSGIQLVASNVVDVKTFSFPRTSGWQHLAFTLEDGRYYKCFVDGVLLGSGSHLFEDSTYIYIGAHTGDKEYFVGYMCEIAFWDTLRYTESFTPPTSPY